MDIRTDLLLARFERCTFERMQIARFYANATVLFVDCVMHDVFDDPRGAGRGVQLLDCRVELLQGERSNHTPLFPDWENRVQR